MNGLFYAAFSYPAMSHFHLVPAPFSRLRELLNPLEAPAEPIDLALGEPRSGFPDFIHPILEDSSPSYGRYPPVAGADFLRQAAAEWLVRRFALPRDFLDPYKHILALSGTREGLFSLLPALLSLEPPEKRERRKYVLIPDPAYHAYAAAALFAGCTPYFLPAAPGNGFLPDFESLPDSLFSQTLAVYLCSPANPQGAAASLDYLEKLLHRVQKHGATLILDECYADIYNHRPPPSALQAALSERGRLDHLIVFHSLSKRSGVPGLRSGFCAGGARIVAPFRRLRESGGAQMPLPLQKASAALWSDDAHAAKNRDLYRMRFSLAREIFGEKFGFHIPDGGFFLWLDVGDGEEAAARAWEKNGVRVLPGAYLLQGRHEQDPASTFLRVALVEDEETLEKGLARLCESLEGGA